MRDPRREPSGDKPAPKAVVGRVSLYLRQLEAFQRQGATTVSSSQLGAALAINDAQVRKDLAFFGQFGYPGIGYRIEELSAALRRILGIDRDWPLALVGLGNLGRALLKYRGFRNRGFRIVALFDNDPHKVGHAYDGMVVRPIEALAEAIRDHEHQPGDPRASRPTPPSGWPTSSSPAGSWGSSTSPRCRWSSRPSSAWSPSTSASSSNTSPTRPRPPRAGFPSSASLPDRAGRR